ncbi:MAG: type IV pilus twitching motility protein PilT [Bdellovibrionaceae bacterium]|nr:type IV pilus twitching motility protein PilT [Pseudobdellovibrionaceae bacterium]MDW8190916.1 type IV pilus twitching motility protein PilT [Pseudobdellovibrionaceae bacterium]
MASIDELLKEMIAHHASDLHITAGTHPYVRVHGDLIPLTNYKVLSNQETQALLFEILSEKQKKKFIETWELDFAYSAEGIGRFRGNIFMQKRGLGGVFRQIPEKIKSAEELGLPKSLIDLINCDKGLILVTGPTGSGKSTTLAALIHYINANHSYHIITIEDPIEFVHKSIRSLVNQREVGSHTKSFNNALESALREDPDVILVGELRDLETISLALTAAETGHVVFATLHTNSAAKTIDRIIDVFPAAQQQQVRVMLAESLRGVIAQTLFRKADGSGRVVAFEIMKNTKAIGNLIREGKTHQIPSAIQTGAKHGMVLFEKSIEELLRKGLITKADALAFLGKTEDELLTKVG